jgi:hypothetical protein
MPRILKNKTVVARKPHRCPICGEVIFPGDRYRYCVVAEDHKRVTCSKYHLDCDALWDVYLEENPDFSFIRWVRVVAGPDGANTEAIERAKRVCGIDEDLTKR